tara:strand:- start:5169 stop:5420 length:252 start_codon:yes stop_codon:yes gene_type:complete
VADKLYITERDNRHTWFAGEARLLLWRINTEGARHPHRLVSIVKMLVEKKEYAGLRLSIHLDYACMQMKPSRCKHALRFVIKH